MAITMIEREEEEVHGDFSATKHTEDCSRNNEICTRTSWVCARTAISHIDKTRATGSLRALWVRKVMQNQFYQLGKNIEKHWKLTSIVLCCLLVLSSIGALKFRKIETNINNLWVEEGGRLEREMNYIAKTLGNGTGTTNQMLIQTPKGDRKDNILNVPALKTHLNVLLAATKVTVDMYDKFWSLSDLCYATSFPYFENHLIDQIFEKLAPCAIITPLDCFWEGSKLLGPDFFLKIPGYGEKVKWTNLNPQRIVEKMKDFKDSNHFFPFSTFNQFMKSAGITTGYQQKPCLDPSDPECPSTAPNKQSLKAPDIGAELTGGCYGFAGRYLHWPEELVVGGTKKNRTNHIVRGEALQSIVQLMGYKDLYEHFQNQYSVIGWSKEKAAHVLEAWVKKFSEMVQEVEEKRYNETKSYALLPYSEISLSSQIEKFSQISIREIIIGCAIMLIYVSLSLFKLTNSAESAAGLGVAGVLMVIFTIMSGLGVCSVLGWPFNAASTQILPYLILGISVNGMFLVIQTISEVQSSDFNSNSYSSKRSAALQKRDEKSYKNAEVSLVGEVMKRCGVPILYSSLCKATAFFAATIFPVPALRIFCFQAGILILMQLLAFTIVFPLLVSFDIQRRKARRQDILCCLPMFNYSKPTQQVDGQEMRINIEDERSKRTTVTRSLSPPSRGTVTQVLSPLPASTQECWVGIAEQRVPSPSLESLNPDSIEDATEKEAQPWWLRLLGCDGWSVSRIVKEIYAPALTNGCVKVFVIIGLLTTIVISAYGMSKLVYGLDLTNIVPSDTKEAHFFKAQQKYFGFYNMFAVTQGNFEYPTKQKLLHEYHEAFNRVPWIIKNDDGGLPDSWLSLFRDWLLGLQKAFDEDWRKGNIHTESWYSNASDSGILAYKLLVQTGYVDHPVDKTLVSQGRLVDAEGIINEKAFYNYLTAWMSNDAFAYSASQSDLRPLPRSWSHERSDLGLKIPKSSPLVYAQFPFYLTQLEDTATIIQMIHEVRTICEKFENKGLPNFPTGNPFTYWEQYIQLWFYMLMAISTVLVAVFLIFWAMFINIWAAFLNVSVLAYLVIKLAGIIGLLGLKFSVVPAVLLVMAVGIGVDFTGPIIIGFLTAVGDKNRRMKVAVSHMASPILHGAVSTFLATLMLMFSEFDFIRRYFFFVLSALVLLGLIDSLLFLPVILSLIGPQGEVVPTEDPDRLPPPSPPVTPPPPYSSSNRRLSSSSLRPQRSSSHRSQNNSYRSSQNSSSHHRSQSFNHHPSSRYHSSKRLPHHHSSHYNSDHDGSDSSLTTITEESHSNGSSSSTTSYRQSPQEILVEPQVIVETTTYGAPHGSRDSDYDRGNHITTTVTATTKVKVVSGIGDSVHRSTGSNSSQSSSSRRSSPTNEVSVSSSRSSRSKKSQRSDSDSDGSRNST